MHGRCSEASLLNPILRWIRRAQRHQMAVAEGARPSPEPSAILPGYHPGRSHEATRLSGSSPFETGRGATAGLEVVRRDGPPARIESTEDRRGEVR